MTPHAGYHSTIDRRPYVPDAMRMSVSPTHATCTDDELCVDLSDGRHISVPLAWYPRLLFAAPAQRQAVRLSRKGLHWDDLDEDISVDGLLAGRGDLSRSRSDAA